MPLLTNPLQAEVFHRGRQIVRGDSLQKYDGALDFFSGKKRRPSPAFGGAVYLDVSRQCKERSTVMGFAEKFSTFPRKGAQRIKSMALFRRPSCKRQNSRNLIKRYFRLIR